MKKIDFLVSIMAILFIFQETVLCQNLNPAGDSQVTQFHLSSTPTAGEIQQAFALAISGACDPFDVLSKVVESKERAIPALDAFLWEPTKATLGKDSAIKTPPNKLYGVLALEAIRSQSAFNVLLKAAQAHPDKEVKGTALRAIALNYYRRLQSDSLAPSKEFLHVLISNTEDTTWVEYCSRRIGEIAREGVKNLTGKDYGDLPLEKKMLKVGKEKKEMTVEAYREAWWTKNNASLKWDKKTAHFEHAQ